MRDRIWTQPPTGAAVWPRPIQSLSDICSSALIVAALAPFIALKTKNLRRLLLAVIMLDLPLQWDVNFSVRKDVEGFGSIVGFNVSATILALGGLYALWFTEFLTRLRNFRPLRLRPSWPLLLYIGFVVLSVTAARDVQLSLFELFLLVQMLLLYIYIVSTVRTREDVRFIVTLLLIGVILEGAVVGMLL